MCTLGVLVYVVIAQGCLKLFRGTYAAASATGPTLDPGLIIYGSSKSKGLNATMYVAFWPLIAPLEWGGLVTYGHDIGPLSLPDVTLAEWMLGV